MLLIARILLNHLKNKKQTRITQLEDSLSKFTKKPPQFNWPDNSQVDIIMPVYNGFEFLDRLFSSIFQNTNIPFRLIMIDDCSSDSRVFPFLEKIHSENPDNTLLLRNKENTGFVKSVNLGFTYSDNHFVVVNTDIEVPPKWLERLMSPIFENKDIASTTPFSNAADIFSFPEFPEDNPIFEGLDVKTLDSFFQHIDSGRMTIEIPSGVGFCMGINKNAAKKIGLFDAETFHQGYCEENDWCMRAKKYGYKNVLVPNLFVFHKQSGSFQGKGKKRLMKKNYWKLISRHTDYLPSIYEFSLKNPLKPFREFLILIITSKTGKDRPVVIIGNAAKDKRIEYAKNSTGETDPDQKTLWLFHDKQRKNMFLQYRYGKYNIEMSVANLNDFENLIDWMDTKTIVLESKDGFPNTNETEAFFNHLKQKIETTPSSCSSIK